MTSANSPSLQTLNFPWLLPQLLRLAPDSVSCHRLSHPLLSPEEPSMLGRVFSQLCWAWVREANP